MGSLLSIIGARRRGLAAPDPGFIFVYHEDGRQIYHEDGRAVQVQSNLANA